MILQYSDTANYVQSERSSSTGRSVLSTDDSCHPKLVKTTIHAELWLAAMMRSAVADSIFRMTAVSKATSTHNYDTCSDTSFSTKPFLKSFFSKKRYMGP